MLANLLRMETVEWMLAGRIQADRYICFAMPLPWFGCPVYIYIVVRCSLRILFHIGIMLLNENRSHHTLVDVVGGLS